MPEHPLAGDHLLHALIDEAAFAHLLWPLMCGDPELVADLLSHLEQDGKDLVQAIADVDRRHIHLSAERLVSTAGSLCAGRLVELTQRIAKATADGGLRTAQGYFELIDPVLQATLVELRHRLLQANRWEGFS
jgi:hypothetical protein